VPLYFGQLVGLQSRTSFTSTGSRIVYQSSGERGFVTIGFLRATSAIIDLSNLQLFLRPPGVGRRAIIGPALRAIGLAEIPMHGAPGRLFFVDGEINGVSGKMAVDTGATVTVLDRQFASQVKARGGGMKIQQGDAGGNFRETDVVYVQSFKLGGVSVYRPDITVANTSLASYGLLGVIGMDVLGQNRSIIDCGERKLYLAPVRR
ncbi:MAG: retropepsin-like aspartic protease family protein, partial [Chthoniobacterales bacterium]